MRVPIATYRLQINDEFTLHDARQQVAWLAHLGISDLYLSPIFDARHGSTHGYDVTDPTRIRESVGGLAALRALADEARSHQMGILLDIVPNHMAASTENPWWRDVLANGPASRYAAHFDIDWSGAGSGQRLRLPVLGAELDELLAKDEIRVVPEEGVIAYHATRFPLRPDGPATGSARDIIDAQHYELVHWRTASAGMSYRRFFDITDLVGVRVEEEQVFQDVHSLIRQLAADGTITGLRIDHIDGLRDPAGYLARLRERVRGPDGEPVYTVVEKILEGTESLPSDWECEGTTGYEFLSLASAFMIEPTGAAHINTHYRRLTGDSRQFGELAREKKLLVMERLFAGELRALASRLADLLGIPATIARRAIAEVTASMNVYRTYVRRHDAVSSTDRRRILEATADALQRTLDQELRDAIVALRGVALLESGPDREARLDWVMRWQQFTGPVMAKGFEDTALYCHNALLAANDVGCDPAHPCMDADEMAAALKRRATAAPLSLNATATHDTKRGEDTRARIAVLSEVPAEWQNRLRRWIRQGDAWKHEIAEEEESVAPSGDVESLLYQTLLGAWPLNGIDDEFRSRVQAYMTKAVREAKEQTSWRQPDEDYEQALAAFIERLMAEFGREGLAEDIGEFAMRIAPHGALNALTQMLLRITAPGIPDTYQGTELWSHTLVDPDNRRSVDYEERHRLFDDIIALRDTPDGDALRSLLDSWQDGRIKLALLALALRFRTMHRGIFEAGELLVLPAQGPRAENMFAFARTLRGTSCIIVLPRWTTALGPVASAGPDVWEGTVIPVPPQLRQPWHNALTGETHPASGALPAHELFRSVPFALLDVSQPIGG